MTAELSCHDDRWHSEKLGHEVVLHHYETMIMTSYFTCTSVVPRGVLRLGRPDSTSAGGRSSRWNPQMILTRFKRMENQDMDTSLTASEHWDSCRSPATRPEMSQQGNACHMAHDVPKRKSRLDVVTVKHSSLKKRLGFPQLRLKTI